MTETRPPDLTALPLWSAPDIDLRAAPPGRAWQPLPPTTNPAALFTDPPRATWLSPIVLIPLALMGIVTASLILILAFWVGCTAGPDLC